MRMFLDLKFMKIKKFYDTSERKARKKLTITRKFLDFLRFSISATNHDAIFSNPSSYEKN